MQRIGGRKRETDTFSKYQLKNGSGKIRFKHVVIYRIDCKNDFIYTILTQKMISY